MSAGGFTLTSPVSDHPVRLIDREPAERGELAFELGGHLVARRAAEAE